MSPFSDKLSSERGRIPLFLFITVAVLGLLVGGFFLYRHYMQKKADSNPNLPAVKIILKNGCGFEGAATDMSNFLVEMNVDVVSTGNAEKFIYDKTIIVVKKMDLLDLQRLMKMTGIEFWTEAENEYSLAPFEIIIGKDYQELINRKKQE